MLDYNETYDPENPPPPVGQTGAMFARGRSKQDYRTPRNFLDAVEQRFGRIDFDLAATVENSVTWHDGRGHFGPGSQLAEDALAVDWEEHAKAFTPGSVFWCNPEFGDIGPWAWRCSTLRFRRGWTPLLVPASVGTEWYSTHVHGKALVLFLRPRLTFVGCSAPYPKDLLLACYGFGAAGFETWKWR